MSGRITDIEGVAKDPRIIYVGTAGGGIWKSTTGGVTFSPIFEKYAMSIGCITVNQNNPDEIWVGTGLYRSKDGGKTWELLGFKDSERIAEVVLNPKDSKIAYVCVLGNLWNPSRERGVYKTKDGGKTWKRILYVDENTGCGDLAIDPQEPDVIYAGMWQVRRMPYFFISGGPGSGFFKSTDGGKTWKKIKKGLPDGELGRIAFDVAQSRPGTIYGIFEAKKETALYRSDDMGESWERVNAFLGTKARPFYLAEIDDGFVGANPPSGAVITYYLKNRHIFGDLKLEILDLEGKVIRSLPTGKRRGINRVYWDMRMKSPKVSFRPGLRAGIAFGPIIPEGTYTIKINKNEKVFYGKLLLIPDPVSAHNAEDRKFQYETVMKLYRMLEKLAYVSDSILNSKKELDERIGILEKEKRKKGLRKILNEFSTKLKNFHLELVSEEGTYTEPKLSERVLDLYSSVSSYGGRPTNSQLLHISVLEEEIKRAEERFEIIKKKEIPQINSKLILAKLKPLKVMEEEEYRKKE